MRPIVNMPEEDRTTDAQKISKDRACGSGDIFADRQTHRQAYSSQYFATAPAGEVTILTLSRLDAVTRNPSLAPTL